MTIAQQTKRPQRIDGVLALLPFAAPVKARLTFSVILALAATALDIGILYIVYRFLVMVVEGTATSSELYGLAGAAAVCTLLRFPLWGLALAISHVASFTLLYLLRVRLADHLARLPLGFFSGRRSGDLKRIMVDEADHLELFLAHSIPELVSSLGVVLAVSVWLFVVDWRMALASVACVPISFVLLRFALGGSGRFIAGVNVSSARMNGSLVEYLNGLATVKVFGGTSLAAAELRQSSHDYAKYQLDWLMAYFKAGTAYLILAVSNVAFILPVGVALYLDGSLSQTDLFFFFMLGIGFSVSLLRLNNHATQFTTMVSGAVQVRDLLNVPPQPEAQEEVTLRDSSVEFRDVSFAYDDRTVLSNVSFHAEPGTVTALVGPSGAGKTTLARLVARFWDVNQGAVLIGGVDVRSIPTQRLMQEVTFIFQDAFVFHDTVAVNLRLGKPTATQDELEKAAIAARAHDFIAALPQGYETVIGDRGASLSGGEKQRIAIARAMLKASPIVILDEATAFTDPDNEAAIQDALSELAHGRTLLVIAHRLASISGAHQILVVDHGEVAERGQHDGLVKAGGLYARMWRAYTASQGLALGDAVRGGER